MEPRWRSGGSSRALPIGSGQSPIGSGQSPTLHEGQARPQGQAGPQPPGRVVVEAGVVVDVAPFEVEVGTVVVVGGGGAGISKTIDEVADLTVGTGPVPLPVLALDPDVVVVGVLGVVVVGLVALVEAVTVRVRVTGVPSGGFSGPKRLMV